MKPSCIEGGIHGKVEIVRTRQALDGMAGEHDTKPRGVGNKLCQVPVLDKIKKIAYVPARNSARPAELTIE